MKVVPLAMFHHLVKLINQPGISSLTFLVGANKCSNNSLKHAFSYAFYI